MTARPSRGGTRMTSRTLSVPGMLTSYVLRVVATAEGSRIAGTLELVDDGTMVVFRSVEELLAALVPRSSDDDRSATVIPLEAPAVTPADP